MQQKERLKIKGLTLIIALFLSVMAFAGNVIFQPEKVSAHAFVIGSDPVDGSTIMKVPHNIHIYFNAEISPLSSASVYVIQNGRYVDISAGVSSIASQNTHELIVSVRTPDTQPQGSYSVVWHAVADKDGHTTFGSIGFNVGYSSLGLAGTTQLGPSSSNNLDGIRTLDAAGLFSIVWECIALAALTVWIGILALEYFVLVDGSRSAELLLHVRKSTYNIQWLAIGALILSSVVEFFLRTTRFDTVQQSQAQLVQIPHGSQLSLNLFGRLLLETDYGRLWLARLVLLLLAGSLLYWSNHIGRKKKLRSSTTEALVRLQPTGALTLATTTEEYGSQLSYPGGRSASRPSRPESPRKTRDLREYMTQEVSVVSNVSVPVSSSSLCITWMLLVGTLALLFVLSNSSVQVLHPHVSAIVFGWLLIVAQGLWIGGFAYLSMVLLPYVLKQKSVEPYAEALIALQRRLTPYLIAGMGVQLISLLFLSNTSISNMQQLLNDPYGRTLLVQLVLTGIMLLASVYALFFLRPQITRLALLLRAVGHELPARRTRTFALGSNTRRLRNAGNFIVIVGMGVLLCSALMSFFAPPIVFPSLSYVDQTQGQTVTSSSQTKKIGDLTVTLAVLPGKASTGNTVVMLINDKNGTPITDAQVKLTTNMQVMDMGTQQAVIKGGNSVYAATFDKATAFNMAGLWTIDVEITIPNQPVAKETFQIMLAD